jgi:hypothetical protein
MSVSNQNRIKRAVENKLIAMLKKDAPNPTKESLQVTTLGVKYLAVAAKLDEAEFGKDLDELGKDGGDPEQEKLDDED